MSGNAAVVAAHVLIASSTRPDTNELNDLLDEDAPVVLGAEHDEVDALEEHGKPGDAHEGDDEHDRRRLL